MSEKLNHRKSKKSYKMSRLVKQTLKMKKERLNIRKIQKERNKVTNLGDNVTIHLHHFRLETLKKEETSFQKTVSGGCTDCDRHLKNTFEK